MVQFIAYQFSGRLQTVSGPDLILQEVCVPGERACSCWNILPKLKAVGVLAVQNSWLHVSCAKDNWLIERVYSYMAPS